MNISSNGIAFLKKEEGLRLKAYKDQVGVWTIGYGNTYYENGVKVKEGEAITEARAEQLLRNKLKEFESAVNKTITVEVNQNKFDAMVSLCYNIGTGGFSKSTLAKRVNNNPYDATIREAFESWKFAGGKPILLNRRKREYDLYSSLIPGVIAEKKSLSCPHCSGSLDIAITKA